MRSFSLMVVVIAVVLLSTVAFAQDVFPKTVLTNAHPVQQRSVTLDVFPPVTPIVPAPSSGSVVLGKFEAVTTAPPRKLELSPGGHDREPRRK